MHISAIAVIAVICLVALVLVSYVVEALRPRPRRPDQLPWDPGIPIQTAEVRGIQVRYIKTGSGPNVVLLHTLRTQLDIFQKVIPELARHFTVYAYDYPGHGWSDIAPSDYAPEDFYQWTAAFLDAFRIDQASVIGISIRGTNAPVIVAPGNPPHYPAVRVHPHDLLPCGLLSQ